MRVRGIGRTGGLLAASVAMAGLLAACGGGSDSPASTAQEGSPAAGSVAASASAGAIVEESAAAGASAVAESPPAQQPAAAGGDLPDPCGLVSSADLTAILGKDPGAGELAGSSPNLRQVCTYPDSTILGVEVGSDYTAALKAIEDAGLGGKSSDLSGLGDQAVFVSYDMGIAQVFAVQGDVMVDVTGMLTKEQAIAVAEAMLAAL